MFFYLNKYYLFLELHGAILFEVEIHAVLKRETWKFEESWQLTSLKLLVVLIQELLVSDIWVKSPKAKVVCVEVLKPRV